MDVAGRNAVVTGAAGGIGAALASELTSRHACSSPISIPRSSRPRRAWARRTGQVTSPQPTGSPDSSRQARAQLGEVDLYFANAGIGGASGLGDDEDWDTRPRREPARAHPGRTAAHPGLDRTRPATRRDGLSSGSDPDRLRRVLGHEARGAGPRGMAVRHLRRRGRPRLRPQRPWYDTRRSSGATRTTRRQETRSPRRRLFPKRGASSNPEDVARWRRSRSRQEESCPRTRKSSDMYRIQRATDYEPVGTGACAATRRSCATNRTGRVKDGELATPTASIRAPRHRSPARAQRVPGTGETQTQTHNRQRRGTSTEEDHMLGLGHRTRQEYRAGVAFIDEKIYPAEAVYEEQMAAADTPHFHPQILEDLKAEAKSRGLWNLFQPHKEWGPGLHDLRVRAARRDHGPVASFAPESMNCNAPDTGNMEVFHSLRVGSAQGEVAPAAARREDPLWLRDDGTRRRFVGRGRTSRCS